MENRIKALKSWRMRVKGKMLPWHVMNDEVLTAIAELNPSTIKELYQVKGMGLIRLKKYGTGILDALRSAG